MREIKEMGPKPYKNLYFLYNSFIFPMRALLCSWPSVLFGITKAPSRFDTPPCPGDAPPPSQASQDRHLAKADGAKPGAAKKRK